MRRLLVVGFLVCVSLLLALLAAKDPCATWFLRNKFHQMVPQITPRLSGVSLSPGRLVIRHLGVDALLVHGSAQVHFTPWWFGKTPERLWVRLDLWGVDAAGVVRAARAQERFDLTGTYNGSMELVLRGRELEQVNGWLLSQAGGRLMIKDTSVLKHGAGARAATNLVVENLKNVDYDIGKVVLITEGKQIKADATFEGASGKKIFQIVWHRGENG